MIGFGEIVVVLFVAIALIKPDDLPKMIREVRKIRRCWNDFRTKCAQEIDILTDDIESGDAIYLKKPVRNSTET